MNTIAHLNCLCYIVPWPNITDSNAQQTTILPASEGLEQLVHKHGMHLMLLLNLNSGDAH